MVWAWGSPNETLEGSYPTTDIECLRVCWGSGGEQCQGNGTVCTWIQPAGSNALCFNEPEPIQARKVINMQYLHNLSARSFFGGGLRYHKMKPLHPARHPLECFASSTGNFGSIVVLIFEKKKVSISAQFFLLLCSRVYLWIWSVQHGLMQLMSKIGPYALRSLMRDCSKKCFCNALWHTCWGGGKTGTGMENGQEGGNSSL